jgi:hypothetical protein
MPTVNTVGTIRVTFSTWAMYANGLTVGIVYTCHFLGQPMRYEIHYADGLTVGTFVHMIYADG